MKAFLSYLLCLGCVLATLLVAGPAAATWTATGFDYTYSNSGWQDETQYNYLGQSVWRKQRNVDDGSAWVTLTAWGRLDQESHPIRVNETLAGLSNLRGEIVLSGNPPPPRPSTWQQKSWVNGSYSVSMNESQTVGGSYEAHAGGVYRAPVLSPNGCHISGGGDVYSDGTNLQESESGQDNLVEGQWYWRTTNSSYSVAVVQANADIDLQGNPGKVVVDAQSWARGWGAYHNP